MVSSTKYVINCDFNHVANDRIYSTNDNIHVTNDSIHVTNDSIHVTNDSIHVTNDSIHVTICNYIYHESNKNFLSFFSYLYFINKVK